MTTSTLSEQLLASPFGGELLDLARQVLPHLAEGGQLILKFLAGDITPATTCQFEKDLQQLLRALGRGIVTWVFNHVESPETEQGPEQMGYHDEFYRRRSVRKNRHGLASLFGHVPLLRMRYEPLEPGHL